MRELALALVVIPSREETAAVPVSEEEFRILYEQTARPLLAYLTRASGSPEMAGDLLQEAYFRLLRARNLPAERIGRKKYLFRIAGNLLRDYWRRSKHEIQAETSTAQEAAVQKDLDLNSNVRDAFHQLRPREREVLWLAYVEEYDHREIAAITGLRYGSIRMLLFRARHKLAALLRAETGVEVGEAKSV